jgi:signal peptidase I
MIHVISTNNRPKIKNHKQKILNALDFAQIFYFLSTLFYFYRCNTQKTLRQRHVRSRIVHMTDPVMHESSSSDTTHAIHPAAPQKRSSDHSLFVSIVVALAFAFIIRIFIAAPYVVSGSSMEPNFHDWNYLIVDRVTYALESPQRGDVIVLDLPQETTRALIKRIIGLPGDTVILSGANPTVTIINAQNPKGFTLNEPYIDANNYGGSSDTRYILGSNQYFVLGDNRKVSADSRIWGLLPRKDIVGRVLLRLYPFTSIGILPASTHY